MDERSRAEVFVESVVADLGRETSKRALSVMCSKFSAVELAALAKRWDFWARPKQLAPASSWRSWGFLCGRGFGKTRSVSEHINLEVEAGRARLIGLAAQNEDKSIEIQVEGNSGLIRTAPPWFRPTWQASSNTLVWPNGATALVLTPEAPGNIRGPEFHLSWLTELQSWPKATSAEAFSNFLLATRLGYARMVWDATPKRGHPIIKELVTRGLSDPSKHVVVRGSIYENSANLGEGVVEDLERRYGNTSQGREELSGELLEDSESAIAQQAWIERARRPMPPSFVRRGLGVDPAITTRRGSDRTGIVEAGLGVDGQEHVIGDYSGKYEPQAWAKLVLDKYVENGCDLVVVETNRGGNLLVANLRAAATERRLNVVVVGKDEKPLRDARTVFVKEVHSRGEKADRARPMSTAYERGRVSHVIGADLASLEETLTTWEPSPSGDSPDDLDALNSIVSEHLELHAVGADPRAAFAGLSEMAKQLQSDRARVEGALSHELVTSLLGGTDRGGRI